MNVADLRQVPGVLSRTSRMHFSRILQMGRPFELMACNPCSATSTARCCRSFNRSGGDLSAHFLKYHCTLGWKYRTAARSARSLRFLASGSAVFTHWSGAFHSG